MAFETAQFELVWGLLPYRTEDVSTRRAVAAEGEALLTRARGATTALPAGQVRASLLAIEGGWAEVRHIVQATRVVERPQSVLRGVLDAILAPILAAQGAMEEGWALVRERLPAGTATRPGTVMLWFTLPIQRLAACLALAANDLATAREWLETYDRWLAWSGAVLGQAEGQALWAEYCRRAGDGAQARAYAARALADASDPRQPLALLAAHRLLGELNIAPGRYDNSAQHLEASLRLAAACAAPYERALTLLALAELRAATGEPEDAARLLAEVRLICEPLRAKPVLARAECLASQLSATAAPAYPAGLSAREVEVLVLVAQGLTNPQVADRLFLSRRTVDQHLRSIYNKLGGSSRAAATHFAVTHGLA